MRVASVVAMARTLIAAVVTAAISLLAAIAPELAASAAPDMQLVHAHGYEGRLQPTSVMAVGSERGPPVQPSCHITYDPDGLWPLGAAVRRTPALAPSTYDYNAASQPVQSASAHRVVRERSGVWVVGTALVPQSCAAAKTGDEGLSAAYHYTRAQNVTSIESKGLLKGGYATPDGSLSPLQAQIDLALPPNRGLPGARVGRDAAVGDN